jgi:hypothetical protein
VEVGHFYGEVIISNNHFLNNYVAFGGAIYLGSMGLGAQVQLSHNLFHSNEALQGGAVYLDVGFALVFHMVSNTFAHNQFVNNTAVLYGPTFAGAGHKLCLLKPQSSNTGQLQSPETATIQLLSGEVFPTFNVFVQDVFFQTIVPAGVLIDLLIASATVVNARDYTLPPEAAAVVGFEEAMLQGDDFATFNTLQIVGLAGEYTLLILPRINFNPALINASFNFTLKECDWPKALYHVKNEPYPRCVASESVTCVVSLSPRILTCKSKAKCSSGCNEPFGKCIGIEKCLCRRGYEGLGCQLVEGIGVKVLCFFMLY